MNGMDETITEGVSVNYRSGIEDFSAKVDFDYIPNPSNYFRFGANVIRHTYTPGVVSLESNFEDVMLDTLIGNNDVQSIESSIYVEDEITWGALKANVGVHASMFNVEGVNYHSVQPLSLIHI